MANDGTIVYSVQNEDDLLLRVNAMNVEEERKGKNDFRAEFIRVLQKNNPSINYTFNLNGNFKTDTKVMNDLREKREEIEDLESGRIIDMSDPFASDDKWVPFDQAPGAPHFRHPMFRSSARRRATRAVDDLFEPETPSPRSCDTPSPRS